MMQEIEEAGRLGIPTRRVQEQENGFAISKVKINQQAEAPTMAMAVGMV